MSKQITITVSDSDYTAMMAHHLNDRIGRPSVGVIAIASIITKVDYDREWDEDCCEVDTECIYFQRRVPRGRRRSIVLIARGDLMIEYFEGKTYVTGDDSIIFGLSAEGYIHPRVVEKEYKEILADLQGQIDYDRGRADR